MFNRTTADTAESAIPLLSISQEHHTIAMDPERLVEKDGAPSVAVASDELTGSSPNPYGSHAAAAHEDEALAANQGRLRRQLLAFALTFMSSWEVIAM
jgi:hypothetical protein